VPGIRRANACQFIRLKPRVARPMLELFRKQVQVSAYCDKSGGAVPEPHIGCGQCHPLPPVFEVKK
jgi:hypothetical protein